MELTMCDDGFSLVVATAAIIIVVSITAVMAGAAAFLLGTMWKEWKED